MRSATSRGPTTFPFTACRGSRPSRRPASRTSQPQAFSVIETKVIVSGNDDPCPSVLSIPASLASAECGAAEELRHASHRPSRHAAQDRTPRIVAGAKQVLLELMVARASRCAGNRVTAIMASTGGPEIRSREALRHRPFQPARPARAVAGTMAAGEARGGTQQDGHRQEHASSSHHQSDQ